MKLLFKQRLFSWFDSYDIYNETGSTVFTVKGQLSWGHCLKIYNAVGSEVGTVKERILTFLPKFEIYLGTEYKGYIKKELSFFTPKYSIDFNGWQIDGNFLEWDYSIKNSAGSEIASVSKELFNWTDTYSVNIVNQNDALCVLMVVLAIDAEKCSRSDN